jgi:hypothetical protein
MKSRLVFCALLALGGCTPAAEESSSPTTSEPTTSGSTTSEAPKKVMHASFVREEKAGDAPALLRMYNDSDDQVLSLTLDDGRAYSFYIVEPHAVTDYVLTASDDMWTDAVLSIHTTDSCVRKPFHEMTGPLSLEPGHAYGIHVSLTTGFLAHIEEEATPEPYVGLRALVSDPESSSSSSPAPSELALSLAGEVPEVSFKTIFTEYPEPYVLVPGSKVEMQTVRFVDRSGTTHESTSPFVLEGAYGYTVHVADEPTDGAEIDVALDALAQ